MESELDLSHVVFQHPVLLFFVLGAAFSIVFLAIGGRLVIFFERKRHEARSVPSIDDGKTIAKRLLKSTEAGHKLALFGFFTGILLFSGACRPSAAPVLVSDRPVSINGQRILKPLPEMSWTHVDNRVQKLADLNGKAVILDFWATYCGPCREEIPHLNALRAKYGPENLVIIGLNVGGSEDRGKIPEFVAGTQIDYEIAFPESDLSEFIFAQSSSIPQTAVFDRKGRMITKIVGFNDKIQKQLDDAVEEATKLE